MNVCFASSSIRAVVTVCALAIAGFAHGGVIYKGGFDPLFFSGSGLFEIDASCVVEAYTVFRARDCDAQFLGATVDLVDGDSSATVNIPAEPLVIRNIIVQDDTLIGVNTWLIGPGFIDPDTCTGDAIICRAPWWIQWVTNPDPVNLYTGACYSWAWSRTSIDGNDEQHQLCVPFILNGPLSTATNVTFTRVPEPGTLLLVAGGLFVAWRMRRRPRHAGQAA